MLFKKKKKRRQEKNFSLDIFIFLKHSYSSAVLFNRVLINAIIITETFVDSVRLGGGGR